MQITKIQNGSFKGRDYSQLYKDMENLKMVREEMIIPKDESVSPNKPLNADKYENMSEKEVIDRRSNMKGLFVTCAGAFLYLLAALITAGVCNYQKNAKLNPNLNLIEKIIHN